MSPCEGVKERDAGGRFQDLVSQHAARIDIENSVERWQKTFGNCYTCGEDLNNVWKVPKKQRLVAFSVVFALLALQRSGL